MNKFAWHVTPTRNIESIMKYGLIPNCPEEDGDLAISLFKTKEYAIKETQLWLNKKWNNIPLSIIKVDISNRQLTENFEYEWITNDSNPILPEKIVEISSLEFNLLKQKQKIHRKLKL